MMIDANLSDNSVFLSAAGPGTQVIGPGFCLPVATATCLQPFPGIL
jgi:hypothetical protein